MDCIQFGIIGCGAMGALHAEALSRFPNAQLVAVCDVALDRAASLAARYQVRAYADAHTMLEAQHPNAVIIATPDDLHFEPALGGLEHGCHVFCEKPLTTNVEQARELVSTATRRNLQLAVNFNRRFGFGYQTAKTWLDEQRIGRAKAMIQVTDGISKVVENNPHAMLTTLLTHHIDLVRWYCGEVVAVTAVRLSGTEASPLMDVILTLDCHHTKAIIVGAYIKDQTRTTERATFIGESGEIVVEDVTRVATFRGRDPDQIETRTPNTFAAGDAFSQTTVDSLGGFIQAVCGSKQVPVTGYDGLRSLEIAQAARQSLQTDQRVRLSS